jgi:hypothetical protein
MSKRKTFSPVTVAVAQGGSVVHFKNAAARTKAEAEFGPNIKAEHILALLQGPQQERVSPAMKAELSAWIKIVENPRGLSAEMLTGLRAQARKQNRQQAALNEGTVLAEAEASA